MDAPQNFRTAFNGFHREDVVRYLEYLNAKHTTQVNQLNSEAESLRQQVAKLEEELAAKPAAAQDQSQEIEALNAQLEAAAAEKQALEAKCAEMEQLLDERSAPTPAPSPSLAEQELEAYRRAERAERIATQRADQIYDSVNSVLSQASGKIDGVSADLGTMADQVSAQLRQLEAAVSTSKLALQEAVETMNTLRPNRSEN